MTQRPHQAQQISRELDKWVKINKLKNQLNQRKGVVYLEKRKQVQNHLKIQKLAIVKEQKRAKLY